MFQARFSVRALLQRHPGGHQGTKSQRQLRRGVQNRGEHVGRARRRAQKCNYISNRVNEWCLIFAFPSQVYKKKTELAKKEYLKALAAYRATLVSKVEIKSFDCSGVSPRRSETKKMYYKSPLALGRCAI